MTREQTTYLRQRLAVVRENKPRRYNFDDRKFPKPAVVVQAEKDLAKATKIIKDFDKKVEAQKKAILGAVDSAHDYCTRLILTGDFKAALAAVDKFEAAKF